MPVRILVVDDFDPWRRFVSSTFQQRKDLQILLEVSDGPEAIYCGEDLRPDLVVLDIGLPNLNGIEAARRIFRFVPGTKIIFVSEERSAEIADEALRTGGSAYVVKSHAAGELLRSIEAALQGNRFTSTGLTGLDCNAPLNHYSTAITHCHEVSFLADDASLIDDYARFIRSALNRGKAVISIVSEAHRLALLQRLKTDGLDLATATEQGRYIAIDAADILARLTVNDMPDPLRCENVIDDLLKRAVKGIKEDDTRVVFCGEVAPTLLSRGNAEGAIELEHLWDQLTRKRGADTLCGYLWSVLPGRENNPLFERICTEHSAVRQA